MSKWSHLCYDFYAYLSFKEHGIGCEYMHFVNYSAVNLP